jgi:hypothetical protein
MLEGRADRTEQPKGPALAGVSARTPNRPPQSAQTTPGSAELLRLQRLVGNRLTCKLSEGAAGKSTNIGPKPQGTSQPVIRRLFGMEKETRVPVRLEGKRIQDYPTIARIPGMLKVDTDNGGSESILEFVMNAFDEHAGGDEEAHAELDRRLKVLEDFIEKSVLAKSGTELSEVAGSAGGTAEEGFGKATLNDKPHSKPRSGPVHFTVGYSLAAMPNLLEERLAVPAKSREKHQGAATHASEALALANWTTAQVADKFGPKAISGFVATLYLHVAALMDGVKVDDAGLKKSLTNALLRVPFHVLYDDLGQDEREWLGVNKDAILQEFQGQYSKNPGSWAKKDTKKKHKKDNDLIPPPIKRLVSAAFVGKDYDPTGDFGKMFTVEASEEIGPTGGEKRARGYAMELRNEKILDTSRKGRAAHAHELVSHSRQLEAPKNTGQYPTLRQV